MQTSFKPATELSSQDEKLIFIMQALADKNRFKMLKLMLSDNMCVSEIAKTLDISVPAASQHFKFFELVGLVDKERTGQKICYQVRRNDPLVKKVISLVNS